MVVHNFNIISVAVSPGEAQPPLIVHPDAVLPSTIARQRLKAIGQGLAEVSQPSRRRRRAQLAARHFGQIAWKPFRDMIRPDGRRAFVRE